MCVSTRDLWCLWCVMRAAGRSTCGIRMLVPAAKSDPYVIVKFGNETGRVQVSRTTTKNNTLNPVYNEVRHRCGTGAPCLEHS